MWGYTLPSLSLLVNGRCLADCRGLDRTLSTVIAPIRCIPFLATWTRARRASASTNARRRVAFPESTRVRHIPNSCQDEHFVCRHIHIRAPQRDETAVFFFFGHSAVRGTCPKRRSGTNYAPARSWRAPTTTVPSMNTWGTTTSRRLCRYVPSLSGSERWSVMEDWRQGSMRTDTWP